MDLYGREEIEEWHYWIDVDDMTLNVHQGVYDFDLFLWHTKLEW